jgi:hypothetical protein
VIGTITIQTVQTNNFQLDLVLLVMMIARNLMMVLLELIAKNVKNTAPETAVVQAAAHVPMSSMRFTAQLKMLTKKFAIFKIVKCHKMLVLDSSRKNLVIKQTSLISYKMM